MLGFIGIFLFQLILTIGLDCQSGQNYVKVVKQNRGNAGEEKFTIYSMSGGDALINGPSYANDELRTDEYCLTSGNNEQYRVVLSDTASNSWASGAYIRFLGKNGNIIHTLYLVASSEAEHVLSLYQPVQADQQWRFTNSQPDNSWTGTSFTDSSWTQVTLPTPSQSTSGTQYLRKTISYPTISHIAAYDVRFYYKAGIIGYVNGQQIYRDNMPDGAVSSSTPANGAYAEFSYKGVIRNANPLTSNSVLAVELHFTSSAPGTSINFNAYMQTLAKSSPISASENCWLYGEVPTTITPSGGTSATQMLDLYKFTYYYYSSFPSGTDLSYAYDASKPLIGINAVIFFPYSLTSYHPRDFTLKGSTGSSTSGTFNTIGTISNLAHTTNVFTYAILPFGNTNYRSMRVTVTGAGSTTLYIAEMYAGVCNVAIPTSIEWKPYTSNIYVLVDIMNIEPLHTGLSGCTSDPALPAGLTLNEATCTVTGVATATSSGTYTITSSSHSISGQITINVQQCSGSAVEVTRTYGGGSAVYETYSIATLTDSTVISVAASSTQQNAATQVARFCLSEKRYKLTIGSSLYSNWYTGSYIFIRAVLDADSTDPILRMRYDTPLGFGSTHYFSCHRPVQPGVSWKYKMDYSDATWFSTSTSAWDEKTPGNFVAGTTKFQVYRKEFSLTSGDIQYASGFSLSVKYQYGILVYLNDNEVYRNNVMVTGELSTLSASGSYSDLAYHTITMPMKTMADGDTSSKTLIQSGTNNLAIALITSTSATTPVFNAALRLFGNVAEDRVIDFTPSFQSISGEPAYAFDKYSGTTFFYNMCNSNFVLIQFDNDRREWISSITLVNKLDVITELATQFTIQGKNTADSTYTTLSTQTKWQWWNKGQHKKVYFLNNKPYNLYRIQNIGTGQPLACTWRMQQVILHSDKTDITIPTLSYPSDNHAYNTIEMAEIFPTGSEYKSDFTIDKALPSGLFIDPPSGVIMGKPMELMETPTMYEVTSRSIDGNESKASFSLDVKNCENSRSLISIIVMSDTSPSGVGFKLMTGKTTSGSVIVSRTDMPSASSKFWIDQCLTEGFYTFEATSSTQGYWYWPAGYWLTIDKDSITLALNHMNSITQNFVFSSYQPFQMEFTDYKLWKKNENVPSQWKDVTFDDNGWDTTKASKIGSGIDAITVYLRKSFNIDAVEDMTIMNVHVLYTGGLIAYFNGKKIARFNIGETFNKDTPGLMNHAADSFSAFHIPLQIGGAVNGKNVMAFELHRNSESSSSQDVVFEASSLMSVQECSIAAVSYSTIGGNMIAAENIGKVIDGDLSTTVVLENISGRIMNITFDNLEYTQYNQIFFTTMYNYAGYGFTFHGRNYGADSWVEISKSTDYTTVIRGKNVVNVPLGLLGFKNLLFTLVTPGAYSMTWSEFGFNYCKASGNKICVGDDQFPTVAAGQESPALCQLYYEGYQVKVCDSNGVFGPVTSHCTQRAPANLKYPIIGAYSLVVGVAANIPKPLYDNIIEKFELGSDSVLPFGLSLNSATGEITGTPQDESVRTPYTIYGSNQSSTKIMTTVEIMIRKGICQSKTEDGRTFEQRTVGEYAEWKCKDMTFGTTKRLCKLGAVDGEWQKEEGICWSYVFVGVLLLVVLLVIPVIICIVCRVTRSKKRKADKAKGSSKSKKGSAAKPQEKGKEKVKKDRGKV